VYYSLDYSADYLIKQFVKKDNNPRMITVVTSDKDIIGYVTRFKAKTMKSEEFAEQLTRETDEWEAAKVPEKEDNPVLSDEEMSFWEGLFKRKKK
jgi:predicted RNA-binding protein with PIN domain